MHTIFQSFLRDLETHKKDANLSDVEKYHINCWRSCKAINTSIDKLKIAEEFIEYSYKFIPSDKEHNLGEYIEFHIENYMIRSRTVYDRVLIFTNNLCNIGMSKEYINHNAIITNQKVIDYNLKPKLKSVNKACEVYRIERNSIIHHDKYDNKELEWLTVAKQASSQVGYEALGITKEQVISHTVDIIARHLHECRASTQTIISEVDHFLDSALPIYDLKANILS